MLYSGRQRDPLPKHFQGVISLGPYQREQKPDRENTGSFPVRIGVPAVQSASTKVLWISLALRTERPRQFQPAVSEAEPCR
jgi:hypothetical protein